MKFVSRSHILAAVVLLTVPGAVFSTTKETRVRAEDGKQLRWISRIISEHIWDYKITSETNPACTQHFEVYRKHLDNFTTWAVQMLDASDLVPSGFVIGDTYKLGNFEECVGTEIPSELGFSAQYCLPTFIYNQTNNVHSSHEKDEWGNPVWNRVRTSSDLRIARKDRFTLAFCIPSTCSSKDLTSSLKNLLEIPMRAEAYDLDVTLDELLCTSRQEPAGSLGSTIMKFFLIGLTGVFLFCSITDIALAATRVENYDITNYSFRKATGIEKWLLPFSLFRNVLQLTAPPTSPDEFRILHGFKALAMMFIVMAHVALFRCINTPLVNWPYTEDKMQHANIVFLTAGMLPDIFFAITGFIGSISMLNQLDKGTFNVRRYVINKCLRVLPPYLFTIALTIFVLPYLGSGPFWRLLIEPEVKFCRKNWWLNLLFLNNYFGHGECCLIHSYHIAADVQFFILGSVIVYLSWRWVKYAPVILSSALFLSFLLPFWSVYQNEYDGLIRVGLDFLTNPREHSELINMYQKSHTRFGGYVAGMIAAFVFRHLKEKNYKFSKGLSWAGLFFAIFSVVGLVVAKHIIYDHPLGIIGRAVFAALNTQILGAAVMLAVLIQINTGFGVLDNLLFTQNIFLPFSRITYWLYLFNVYIIIALVGSLKTPIHMTYEETAYMGRHLGDFLPVYALAFYGYLTIEAPISHLKPIILQYFSQPSSTHIEKIKDS